MYFYIPIIIYSLKHLKYDLKSVRKNKIFCFYGLLSFARSFIASNK